MVEIKNTKVKGVFMLVNRHFFPTFKDADKYRTSLDSKIDAYITSNVDDGINLKIINEFDDGKIENKEVQS